MLRDMESETSSKLDTIQDRDHKNRDYCSHFQNGFQALQARRLNPTKIVQNSFFGSTFNPSSLLVPSTVKSENREESKSFN